MGADKSDDSKLKEAILSALRGSAAGKSATVKELRKEALLSIQADEDDKDARNAFKNATKALEAEGALTLSEDGVATLTKKGKNEEKRKASEDGDAKGAKKRKTDDDDEDDGSDDSRDEEDEEESIPDSAKNKPCKGNPTGCTRLFVGNLPFAVDETSLNDFLSGGMTHVKWITDSETGKFYGSAFVEMRTSKDAAGVVSGKAGTELMGRAIKLNFAPARPGDVWPPKKRESKGGGGQAGGAGKRAMSAKPEGCVKLFIGNLSYKIDDDGIKKFFANVGSEVKAVRWLHHQGSGDFKGCGFVEFWNTDACDKAATLNGKNLLGRPIRIDWTD